MSLNRVSYVQRVTTSGYKENDMDISVTELWLLVVGAIGWGLYFREKERRNAADWFAKQMIENDRVRETVVEQFKEWRKTQEGKV